MIQIIKYTDGRPIASFNIQCMKDIVNVEDDSLSVLLNYFFGAMIKATVNNMNQAVYFNIRDDEMHFPR